MKYKKLIILISLLFSNFSFSQSNGINLAATRVVFDSKEANASLKINNNSEEKTWLLRSWVSAYNSDEKVKNFIITPPLYRIDPTEIFQLRINKINVHLPEDRESVFRINVLAIPSNYNNDTQEKRDSGLQFAINNRIKLIYRPHNLNVPKKVDDAYKALIFSKSENQVHVKNPTPYYITMNDVKINEKSITSIKDFMVSPFSTLIIPEKNAKTISYSTINDYGGKTPTQNIKL
ncbi:TPA: molecular chaperone [Escherichia coli]